MDEYDMPSSKPLFRQHHPAAMSRPDSSFSHNTSTRRVPQLQPYQPLTQSDWTPTRQASRCGISHPHINPLSPPPSIPSVPNFHKQRPSFCNPKRLTRSVFSRPNRTVPLKVPSSTEFASVHLDLARLDGTQTLPPQPLDPSVTANNGARCAGLRVETTHSY